MMNSELMRLLKDENYSCTCTGVAVCNHHLMLSAYRHVEPPSGDWITKDKRNNIDIDIDI